MHGSQSARLAILLLVLLFSAPAISETAPTREIEIDGDSSDFLQDEEVFTPSEELDFDSWWLENNDINQIKVTWDSEHFYVAVDGRIWDNNLLVFFDVDSSRGLRQMDNLNAWSRKLEFLFRRPDKFLGTWDQGTAPEAPQMWELEPGSSSDVRKLNNDADYFGASTFSQGQTGKSLEVAIPWATLFGESPGTVPEGAEIAIVAVLVQKDDHTSGPDCAPNNVLGMPQNTGDFATIDNFAVFHVDRDGNGEPDIGVSPVGRVGDDVSEDPPLTFLHDPAGPRQVLELINARALPPAFSPNGDGVLDASAITFALSTAHLVNVDVFDPLGRHVRNLAYRWEVEDDEEASVTWDGRDNDGVRVDAGVYIVRVATGRGDRVNVPVAVLR